MYFCREYGHSADRGTCGSVYILLYYLDFLTQTLMDKAALLQRVKACQLLTEKDKRFWEEKMETMKETDLKELSQLLDEAAKIDLGKALPAYEKAVEQATTVYDQAMKDLENFPHLYR